MLDLEKERDHPYWVTMLNMMHCSFAFCCWFHNYEVVGVVLRLGVDLLAVYLFCEYLFSFVDYNFVDVFGFDGLRIEE